jgi:hypothetical protein
MNEENQKPGRSVREMLRARSTEKALSSLQARERSQEETAAAKKVWAEMIGGRPRKRPWK